MGSLILTEMSGQAIHINKQFINREKGNELVNWSMVCLSTYNARTINKRAL
jgi:hypothetical protein